MHSSRAQAWAGQAATQPAHHFGVQVVNVPATAAHVAPGRFAFGDLQLHLGAAHPAVLILSLLGLSWV